MLLTDPSALLTATVFDSGSLAVLTSLVHQFAEPGSYRAEVLHAGQAVAAYAFEASERAGLPRLEVDLASLHHRTEGRTDCACDEPRRADTPVVSTDGFVVFFVSHGDAGYSVRVGRDGSPGRLAFDSGTLGEGDLFVLSLLEPVRYAMANRLGAARGSIDVSSSREPATALETLEARYLETFADRFEPAALAVASNQGIVFQVREAARIVVQRESRPKRPAAPRATRPRPLPRS
jgi:hypothetical protein